jgi:hydrogenase expression/formation protein HypD
MKFVDEFRQPDLINKTVDEIRRLTDPHRHYRLMEVCGGHTHAIYRFGLKDLLPENIEFTARDAPCASCPWAASTTVWRWRSSRT